MISKEEFKAGMSYWATGVSIVTARHGDRIHGMTVSDFSSVSLSPPLVLVCAARESITHEVIAAGRCFAVNLLSVDQQELAKRFASKKHEHQRFVGLETRSGATGAPLLPEAAAIFDCRLSATFAAGDHDIHVGQVEELVINDRAPLVYYQGRYDQLVSSTTVGDGR